MKYNIKIAVTLLLFITGLTSCSSQHDIKTNMPFKVETVFYQNWVGGQELTGSGTNFFIKFEASFPANIQLKKVYFHDKEVNFEKRDSTTFVAYFYRKPDDKNKIESTESLKSEYDLSDTEAILEFEQDTKTQLYKIKDIKEKELIAYPSAKPRN